MTVLYVQKCFVNMYVAMLDFGQEWKGTGLTVLFHTSTSMKANTQECCAVCTSQHTEGEWVWCGSHTTTNVGSYVDGTVPRIQQCLKQEMPQQTAAIYVHTYVSAKVALLMYSLNLPKVIDSILHKAKASLTL